MIAKRLALAVLIGGLGTAAGGVALANGGHNAATGARPTGSAFGGVGATGTSVDTIAAIAGTNGRGKGSGGGFGFGPWGTPSRRGGRPNCGVGAAGQVTAIPNNTTISLSSRRTTPVTVTVSATTAYTEAGQTASFGDVHVGSRILACGAGTATSVQATQVYIILDQVTGVVTKVAANGATTTLTLTGFDNTPYTVTTDSSTTYRKAGQATASSSDVTDGTAISVQGVRQSDGTLTAKVVEIQVPRVAGRVTSVTTDANGLTIALTDARGVSTVTTSNTTSYRVISPTATAPVSGTAPTSSIVQSGSYLMARGTLSGDGKTLNATQIVVLPSSGNGFFGRRGGFFHRGRSGGAGVGGPPTGGNGFFGPRGGFMGGQNSGAGSNGQIIGPRGGFGGRVWGGQNGGAPAAGSGSSASNV